ncbi:MAG TPA: hypothetical protein VFP68_09305, partial [Burkholderiaceae bacterium]|nr:hypothetical protein [Burkholderiaceae bacterium]
AKSLLLQYLDELEDGTVLASLSQRQRQDALLKAFRAQAREIEESLEEDHILDSPDSRIRTGDYNKIMEALAAMFHRIPDEPMSDYSDSPDPDDEENDEESMAIQWVRNAADW